MTGNRVATQRTDTNMQFDRQSVERSFREAVREAVRMSFAAGKPIYGRERTTGKPVLVYADGRRVEIVVRKRT